MADAHKPKSLIRKLASKTVALCVTAGFFVLAAVAIQAGNGVIAQRAAAVEKPDATVPVSVNVSALTMVDSYSVDRAFTGQIEAPQFASMAFERGGTLETVMVDDGDTVRQGDVLAVLDDRLLKADIERLRASKQALEAQLELAKLTDQRQADLKERGFASAQSADQSRLTVVEINARLAEMDAGILSAEINLEKTVIRAPFDGRVNARRLDPGSAVAGGQEVLSLVENGAPMFRVGIAPDLVSQLELGQTIELSIEGTNQEATIAAILPQIDPVTRTRIVRARINDGNGLAFGMTGTASLTQTVEARGSWIPLSALEDGVRGLWTIKTVTGDEEPTVAIEAVEVIHADGERAYVRGTFDDNVTFIKDGLNRVVAGQAVRVEN